MRARMLLVSLFAMATYAGAASAQEVGSRVRVRDSTTEVTGTLLRLDADSIVVRADILNTRGRWVKEDVALPLTPHTTLDVSTERRSSALKGALIGFGIMAVVWVWPVASLAAQEGGADPSDAQVAAWVVIPTAIVTAIGYAIGSANVTETWAEVRLDHPPPGDPQEVTRGMVHLGLRLKF